MIRQRFGGSLDNGIGYVKASNTGQHLYGRSIAIRVMATLSSATVPDGDRQVVTMHCRSRIVYVRSGWTQQAYVKASNTVGADFVRP